MRYQIKLYSFFALAVILVFASCRKNDVSSITLNESKIFLKVLDSQTLTAKVLATGNLNSFPVSWISSDTNVVKVDKGVVKALSNGTSTVIAKSGDEIAICEVKVVDICPDLKFGMLIYYGDFYGTQTDSIVGNDTNNFSIYLGTDAKAVVDTTATTGEVLFFELNTAANHTNEIPAGVYSMIQDYSKEFLKPFTILPTNSSFYYNITKSFGSYITVGRAVITVSNGIYKISFDFTSETGKTIGGIFQGELQYYNNTNHSSAPSSVKEMLSANQAKKINPVFKIKR